jgi:Protein of unknown function (DUF2635)
MDRSNGMKVYPVAGKTVRDMRTRPPMTVPPEGLNVPDLDPFWLRRVKAGDVTRTAPVAEPVAPAPHAEAATAPTEEVKS